jgi:hypothetical protein
MLAGKILTFADSVASTTPLMCQAFGLVLVAIRDEEKPPMSLTHRK